MTKTPEQLLTASSTPFWARDIIHIALTKDCVDAASTLDVLAAAFRARAEKILKEG